MGFFSDLFSGSTKAQDFDPITVDRLGPPGTGSDSKAFFQNVLSLLNEGVTSGQTDESSRIFSSQRGRTISQFEDLLDRSNLNFNRLGLGSSGFRDKRNATLSLGLAELLSEQDAQQAQTSLDNRLRFATQGTQALTGLTGQTQLNPIVRDEGFGSQLLKQILGQGAGAATTFGIGSAFGFGGGGGGGLGSSPTGAASGASQFLPFR